MNSQRSELKSGVILSYVSLFLENIIPLFYTPWMLGVMGTSEYGLYNLANSVIGYLSLLSIGLGSSILKFLSDKIANDDRDGVNKLTGLFTLIYVIIGAVSLICGFFIAWNADVFFGASLTVVEISRLKILLIISTINTAVTFPLTVYNSLIIGHQKFIFNKGLGMVATIVTPCLNVIVLLSGARSVGLVLVATISNIFFGVIKVWYCFAKLKIRPQFRHIDFSPMRSILAYSVFIFLGEISSMLYWATDKVLLGAYCGTTLVSIYSVGAAFNTYYNSFSTAISNVMFPRVNSMVQKKAANTALSDVLIQVGRIQYLVLCLITTGFILFGEQFIVLLWGGPEYQQAYYVALLTMIPSLIPLIQNVGLSIIQAESRHQFRTVCFFIIAIVNIVLSWLLVKDYGLLGCAIPTCLAYLVGQGIIMNWYYWKKIHLDIPRFWKNIGYMTIPVVPLFVVAAIMIYLFKIDNVLTLFGGILAYSIAYVILAWKFMMNDYEKGIFKGFLRPVTKFFRKR